MLVKTHPTHIQFPSGDIFPFEALSREEEKIRQEEASYLAASQQRLPEQNDFIDPRPRLGKLLSHNEFIARLRRALPTLHVQDGAPGCLALYRPTPNGNQLLFLGWIYKGESPEYSSYILGRYDVPLKERRGWRTVLLRLVQTGHISERQAIKHFGRPSNGITAKHWNRGLWLARNHFNKEFYG